MGSGRVTEPSHTNDDWIPELFDKAFPEYLAMGMTYRQFWDEDCRLVVPYRQAYKIRQEEINRTAWLNGLYIQRAVASVLSKKAKYPKKPFGKEDADQLTEIICTEDMTEEEKKRATDLFFGNLAQMQRDFEKANGTGKGK